MDQIAFLKAARRLHALQAASGADTSFAGEFREIARLLQRLGISDGHLVDIAASDGVTQSSTLPLFQRGWRGLAVEMDPDKFAGLAFVYAGFAGARLARCRVTPHNVGALLAANEVPLAFDLFNLDIDSYDLFVIEAVLAAGYRPKLISMEINEKIPVPIHFAVTYDADHVWQGDHFYGCSLSAAAKLLRANGYLLESLEYNNALFVDRAVAGAIADLDDGAAYRQGYAGQPDRQRLFPWNSDMETLQTLPPAEAMAAIRRKFAAYDGRFVLETEPGC